MKTLHTTSANVAAGIIKNGGIVAFPTETVYGLGANIFDEAAVAKIFRAKQRPVDNPLIAHIADLDLLPQLSNDVSNDARKLFAAFFPGPLTIVLRKTSSVPTIATAGLDTIGIRMPGLESTRTFLRACGVPVVAPSANLSGRPSPTTWRSVSEDLDGRIDCILVGDDCEIGLESTVVDCSGEVPALLRAGSVTLEQLRNIVPQTREISFGDDSVARSPGIKHRHYSPNARVVLIDESSAVTRDSRSAFIGLERPDGDFRLVKICASAEEYAHSLFEFFRQCDRHGIAIIYCESVAEVGIGTALMDRLRRAEQG